MVCSLSKPSAASNAVKIKDPNGVCRLSKPLSASNAVKIKDPKVIFVSVNLHQLLMLSRSRI